MGKVGAGIANVNWYREGIRRASEVTRGINVSTRVSTGIRQLDSRQTAGGLIGTALAPDAINAEHLGNINSSASFGPQASMLPIITDAEIDVRTFGVGDTTVDVQIYAASSPPASWSLFVVGGPISAHMPDGSVLSIPAFHFGHDYFASGLPVYVSAYFDTLNVAWKLNYASATFAPATLALAFGDRCIPILATPANTNTGLHIATGGDYIKTFTGPGF